MQSSAARERTCLVRVETKVRRNRSCCSAGRDCSFGRSSSGVEVAEGAGGGGGADTLSALEAAALGASGVGAEDMAVYFRGLVWRCERLWCELSPGRTISLESARCGRIRSQEEEVVAVDKFHTHQLSASMLIRSRCIL